MRIPERLTWAVARLPAVARGPVLEIGFGAGHALGLLLARFPDVPVIGIDRSASAVARARARLGEAIAAGRLRVEPLALAQAADGLGTGTVALALSVNVNAFWTAPAPSFGALARLLAPAGVAHLVFEPPGDAALDRLRRELPALAAAHGFRAAAIEVSRFRATAGVRVVVQPGW